MLKDENSISSAQLPKLAFVILTWNSECYIASCLDSALALDGFEVLILVVDNGSTDDTPVILQRYEQSDPRVITTVLPENRGTTTSRNIALRALPRDFDYVCILDSDTRVNGAAFAAMKGALEADPSIGIVGPRMVTNSGEVQLSGRNLPTLGIKLLKACPLVILSRRGARMEIPDSSSGDTLQDVPYLLSACWFMPRHILDTVGYLDEAIFYAPEDVDYCVRVRNAGYRVVFCEDAEIVHEYQRISKKKLFSRANFEHMKGLVHYFRKYGYLFDPAKAHQIGDRK